MDDYITVFPPEIKGEEPLDDSMLMETLNAEAAWARGAKSHELADVNPELIAWGVDSSADLLCWDASVEDSDRWPVLVFNPGRCTVESLRLRDGGVH